MITMQQVWFRYRKQNPVLEQLDLALDDGHRYGLLGVNGAGKSTLLKLMAGLAFPQQGSIANRGYEPKQRIPQFLQKVFFLPESFELPNWYITEYIRLYAPFYPDFDKTYFAELAADLQLPASSRLTAISYGQQKKFLIAFGLATGARCILMDEPTNGLDIPSKGQFRKIMAGALAEDRTIVISTHQVRDLDNLIDTVLILDRHRIAVRADVDRITEVLAFGESSEIHADDLYTEASVGRVKYIRPNTDGIHSRMDMELLFNAVVQQREKITSLL